MLGGLSRWNQERTLAASQQQDCQLRSFNLQLACKVPIILLCLICLHIRIYQVNKLSESFLGSRLLPYHHAPTQHNDEEFFGVEYLYRQAGRQFSILEDSTPVDDAPIDEVDEGFVDNSTATPSTSEHLLTVGAGTPQEEDDCEGIMKR